MVQSISKKSLLFLTLFSLVIAAPPGDDESILGKWELDPEIFKDALLKNSGLEGEELELATTAAEAVSIVFEFNEDGTFSMSVSTLGESESVAGEWKLDGTALSMRMEDSEEWDAAEITLGEGKLAIANEDETLVFKRSE